LKEKKKILFKNVKTRSCEQDSQLKFLTSVTNVFYFLSMQKKKRKITDKKKEKTPKDYCQTNTENDLMKQI